MADENAPPTAQELSAVIERAETLGTRALARGDLNGAESVFKELLGIQPANPTAICGLGEILRRSGDTASAEKMFKQAVTLAPQSPVGYRYTAELLLSQGRVPRAQRNIAKARALAPNDAGLLCLEALASKIDGDGRKALALLRQALATDPDHVQANNDLGCLLIEMNQPGEAESYLLKAVENPDATTAMAVNLGNLLILQGRALDACEVLEQAQAREPDNVAAMLALATAKRRAGQLDDARLLVEKAMALAPELASAANLAGTIYRELGLFEEAEQYFDQALELAPGEPNATANRAMLRLLHGDWKAGLPDYEARFDTADCVRPWGKLPLPDFRGGDAAGKTILVCSEQGFGDSIQFCRFLRPLAEQGADVCFAVQPQLARLMTTLNPSVRLVSADEKLSGIESYTTLMSLPLALGLGGPDEIDGAPYLEVPDGVDASIAAAIGELPGLKVGINWRGATGHKENFKRSIPKDLLTPLLGIENVSFVRLDVGAADEDLPGTVDIRDRISDFADAAQAIDALDLVISVDTATAHLAGALGKPCWTLLAYVADWRWLLTGSDCSWYDSMTLRRQPTPGDWESVIAETADALRAEAG